MRGNHRHRRHDYWLFVAAGARQRFDRLVRQLKITPAQLAALKARKERAS